MPRVELCCACAFFTFAVSVRKTSISLSFIRSPALMPRLRPVPSTPAVTSRADVINASASPVSLPALSEIRDRKVSSRAVFHNVRLHKRPQRRSLARPSVRPTTASKTDGGRISQLPEYKAINGVNGMSFSFNLIEPV